MKLSIIQETDISGALDQRIRETLRRCFPEDDSAFSQTRSWHGSAPAWSILIEDAGRIVAHAGIVDRIIQVGKKPVRVAGIQNVGVVPECRGQGLSSRMMIAAMEEAAKLGFDAGLLYCLPVLEKVYANCGWKLLPGAEIIRVDEFGAEVALPAKNVAMFFPLKMKEFPPGTIHLQGNDW